MGAPAFLDHTKPGVAAAIDLLLPAIDLAFVEQLAARLAPHRADLCAASARMAAELIAEAKALIPPLRMHRAEALVNTAVDLAARQVAEGRLP